LALYFMMPLGSTLGTILYDATSAIAMSAMTGDVRLMREVMQLLLLANSCWGCSILRCCSIVRVLAFVVEKNVSVCEELFVYLGQDTY
jgi:hypothetical protein